VVPTLGLNDDGFVDGRHVRIEYRWSNLQNDRLPELVADLVRRGVAVIAAGGPAPALVAKAATTTIPIVFNASTVPIDDGLVTSVSRPDANLTGVAIMSGTAAAGTKNRRTHGAPERRQRLRADARNHSTRKSINDAP
jgi:putative tryptophan/tyrosine transport system substrate-binding protein